MARILVIEDSRSLRKLYSKDLEEDGHEVVTAENAIQGLRLCETVAPQLVVMDIRMPALDGLDAVARILSQDPRIPIVLNSAYSSHEDTFLSWAADACLTKSSDTSELRSTIREILDARRQVPADRLPASRAGIRNRDPARRSVVRSADRARS